MLTGITQGQWKHFNSGQTNKVEVLCVYAEAAKQPIICVKRGKIS